MRSGNAWRALLGLAAAITLAPGCVQRKMLIVSDPPGAMVRVNGREVGATPCVVPSEQFIFYGNYRIQLMRDGYEPLLADVDVPAPWYEWPGVDFISENLVPWTIKDHRTIQLQMQPARIVSPEDLLSNANRERERAQTVGLVPDGIPSGPPIPVSPVPQPAANDGTPQGQGPTLGPPVAPDRTGTQPLPRG